MSACFKQLIPGFFILLFFIPISLCRSGYEKMGEMKVCEYFVSCLAGGVNLPRLVLWAPLFFSLVVERFSQSGKEILHS